MWAVCARPVHRTSRFDLDGSGPHTHTRTHTQPAVPQPRGRRCASSAATNWLAMLRLVPGRDFWSPPLSRLSHSSTTHQPLVNPRRPSSTLVNPIPSLHRSPSRSITLHHSSSPLTTIPHHPCCTASPGSRCMSVLVTANNPSPRMYLPSWTSIMVPSVCLWGHGLLQPMNIIISLSHRPNASWGLPYMLRCPEPSFPCGVAFGTWLGQYFPRISGA